MDLNKVRIYRYANNYVQERINHYKFECDENTPGSAEYEYSLKYLLYWKEQYKQISDDEQEEMRRDK